MQLGAIFPQTEIGSDPVGVRDFTQAAEAMGYEDMPVFDHVLGADASKHPNWERRTGRRTCFMNFCAIRLPRRRHREDQVHHRSPDFGAAADSPSCQTGG